MSALVEIDATSPLWEPVERWEEVALRAVEACRAQVEDWPSRTVSIRLCDDAEMRSLNREWRGFDKPTNVLSFPAADMGHPEAPLGDIALSFETCTRESTEEGKRLEDHVTHLVIHGVLHLLGLDHDQPHEADEMEEVERRILGRLGIADPYRVHP